MRPHPNVSSLSKSSGRMSSCGFLKYNALFLTFTIVGNLAVYGILVIQSVYCLALTRRPPRTGVKNSRDCIAAPSPSMTLKNKNKTEIL